ncbi:hypothetical protein GGI42DRAFT_337467, partial [Trichoderma sp. SZMC 28013]
MPTPVLERPLELFRSLLRGHKTRMHFHDDDGGIDNGTGAGSATAILITKDNMCGAFTDYRWRNGILEIQHDVSWKGNLKTVWTPAAKIQSIFPELLNEYWKAMGMPTNPQTPQLHGIYDIIGHKRRRSQIRIHWLCYPREEATWESRRIIAITAKDIVAAYFDKINKRRRHKTKTRRRM